MSVANFRKMAEAARHPDLKQAIQSDLPETPGRVIPWEELLGV